MYWPVTTYHRCQDSPGGGGQGARKAPPSPPAQPASIDAWGPWHGHSACSLVLQTHTSCSDAGGSVRPRRESGHCPRARRPDRQRRAGGHTRTDRQASRVGVWVRAACIRAEWSTCALMGLALPVCPSGPVGSLLWALSAVGKEKGPLSTGSGAREGCQARRVPGWGGKDGKARCGVHKDARTGRSFRKRYQPS